MARRLNEFPKSPMPERDSCMIDGCPGQKPDISTNSVLSRGPRARRHAQVFSLVKSRVRAPGGASHLKNAHAAERKGQQ
eukprot:1464378-Pyramimonas_sp.AAC.1